MVAVQEVLEPGEDQHEPNAQGQQDESAGPKLPLVILPGGVGNIVVSKVDKLGILGQRFSDIVSVD